MKEQTQPCIRATCGASRIGHGSYVTKEGVVSSISAQLGTRTASLLHFRGAVEATESIGIAPPGVVQDTACATLWQAGVENAALRVAEGRLCAGFLFAT